MEMLTRRSPIPHARRALTLLIVLSACQDVTERSDGGSQGTDREAGPAWPQDQDASSARGADAQPLPFPPARDAGAARDSGRAPSTDADAPRPDRDAEPNSIDADTRCGTGFAVELSFVDNRADTLVTRLDVVEIEVVARAGELEDYEVTVEAGGIIQTHGETFTWTAGGPDSDGHVPVPHWTSDIELVVSARDHAGCTASSTLSVTLAGDVVTGTGNGALFAYGSGGRPFKRLAQLSENPIGDVIALPVEASGEGEPRGMVAAVRASGDDPPLIIRLDDQGLPVGEPFSMLAPDNTPVYVPGLYPNRLAYDPVRREILADNDDRPYVHRWSLEGRYRGYIEIPTTSDFRARPIGFGILQGVVVVGQPTNKSLYLLPDGGEPTLLGRIEDSFDNLYGVANGHGDTVFAIGEMHEIIYRFGPGGRTEGEVSYRSGFIKHMIPFLGGYLALNASGGAIRYYSADFEEYERAWGERGSGGSSGSARPIGIAWLD